jgi:hypothetical protein
MEMKHLSDSEVEEMLLAPATENRHHLEQCDSCKVEVQRIRRPLETLNRTVRTAAEKPEDFWQRQRMAIRERIAATQSRPIRRPARLAWAAAALIATATLVLDSAPKLEPPQARIDPDHELLIEVERILQSDGPQALEPAALLTREISQDTQPNSTFPLRKKESHHEN